MDLFEANLNLYQFLTSIFCFSSKSLSAVILFDGKVFQQETRNIARTPGH